MHCDMNEILAFAFRRRLDVAADQVAIRAAQCPEPGVQGGAAAAREGSFPRSNIQRESIAPHKREWLADHHGDH